MVNKWVRNEMTFRMPVASKHTSNGLLCIGMMLGAKTALGLSPFFTVLFFITLNVLESLFNRQVTFSDIGTLPLEFIVLCLVSVFPALVVGAVGGGIIGWLFQLFRKPLAPPGAFSVGVSVGMGLLLSPTLWLGVELLNISSSAGRVDGAQWLLMVCLPALFVLFGLGWVGYRMNQNLLLSTE
jgi:hypothetical protein